MNTIALIDGDIGLDVNGQIKVLNGLDAEKQIVKSALLTFFGECDLNQNVGIEWEDVLGEKLNPTIIMESIRINLEQLGFVESAKFTNFNLKNRQLIFSCEIINKNGEEFNVSNN